MSCCVSCSRASLTSFKVLRDGCRSNLCPENSTANNHDFQMHCFEGTTSCRACSMLLRCLFPPRSSSFSLSLRLSLSTLPPPGGFSSRAIVARAVKWRHTKSVWAEWTCVAETQVRVHAPEFTDFTTAANSYNICCLFFSFYRICWYYKKGKPLFI